MTDVVVVGAGPAGLTAAAALAEHGVDTLVLDREAVAGGIPRHSDHTGYGLRDLHRVMTGPTYARRLRESAVLAGATVRTHATVTDWDGDHAVLVTTPQGRLRIEARAIVLATGARERPRAARLIPGDRPSGVLTTGQLQNLVHLQHRSVGTRAVVVGAELVSWSAVMTLRDAGCATVLMTTKHSRPESYAALTAIGRTAFRTPVATRTRVTRVLGHGRLQAVEIEHLDSGARRIVDCDTVVFTGDWVPDHELARAAGLAMDPGSRSPVVDTALRTSSPGIFAIGNLVHPADTADVAALDGRHVADQVLAWLGGQSLPADGVRIVADAPFRWVAPGLVRPGDPAPARGRLLLWSEEAIRVPRITVTQDGRLSTRRVLPWPVSPGRVCRVPWSLLRGVDPSGGPVRIGVERTSLG